MARPVLNPRASAESLHSIHSVLSTTSALTFAKDTAAGPVGPMGPPLQPTAASSTHFLFAQGRSVLCVKHNTLELDRRFERHSENVMLINVDNSSEVGYRRVVSIDDSREAIVWDFTDGEELHRFSPFEEIRVAAWMRNGNLSLGDCKGNVIVFNPAQGDSILSRTISDPLCALAPSADCVTFALGYNNGSILVATLTPFTILHTLTTSSLSPSPIASLAWHTSSSKQKSDMLTTQTRDGDLRVWSVAKTLESGEPAKVVRILNKEGGNKKGNNWCAWSMKGRVIQYSEGETTIWDVRNKKVFSEPVNTPANLAGIAVYGPKGNLFTITDDHTVQQYELYPPSVVATVQHVPTVPPPSPPSSIEEKKDQQQQQQQQQPQEDANHQIERLNPRDLEYSVATMSPLGRIAHELEMLEKMEAQGLGISNLGSQSMQRTASASSRTTISTVSRRPSVASTRSAMSVESDQRSIDFNDYDMNTPVARNRKDSLPGRGSLDHGTMPSPGRRPHPLAQEIIASPIEQVPSRIMLDLFGNIRARLPFVVNDSPRIPTSGKKDVDELRREMLYTIFGWRGDVDGLIRDELDSVDARSLTAVMLRMWLGELDQNALSVLVGADFMVSADWLFLALSAMDGKKAWDTVARAMVMRLMQKDDIHTAAVVLLALGNAKDAVDVYVTHNMYMEAVILAAYLWKNDWKKLSQLVRKWGDYATSTHDNFLASRCFACCGAEATEESLQTPITPVSHKRQKSDTESISSFIKNLPAAGSRASLRLVTSSSPLKLITTFPTPTEKNPEKEKEKEKEKDKEKPSIASRFFGWANDKHSVKSPIQTPIAQSPIEQWKAFPVFPRSHTATPRLPSVDETGSEETPRQTRPSQGLPYETKLDLPKIEPRQQVALPYETKLDIPQGVAAPAPKEKSMSISGPVGNNKESGSRPTAPVTLGQQITRSGTPSGTPQQKQSPFNENIFRAGTPGGRSPSGSPQIGAAGWDAGRNLPVRRAPAGLQIHFPTMDGILNGDTELAPPVIKPARNMGRSVSQKAPRIGRRGSGRDSDDSLPDIEEDEEGRSRSRRRRGSPDRRGRSYSRRPGEGSHIRSPSSPLPFSAQADLYKEEELDEGYYTRPRGRREHSEERGRARSRSIQGGSIIRSPSSPLPMSAEAHLYREEEEDEFDESYYNPAKIRARSHARMESRTRSRVRDGSRVRDESRPRAESRIRVRDESRPRGESRIRVRDESRPRGESRIRVRDESPARRREESRPRGESRMRARDESRPRGESRIRVRDESPPRRREESRPRGESRMRVRDESRPRRREESRARGESRARSRQPEERGRSSLRIPNMMRSPSSPLPMSAEAALYRYDEDETDNEPPVRARSRLRDESRPRGRRRDESVAREMETTNEEDESDLRRSRSERTLNNWAKQFERSASVDRRPSAPDLPSRAMSIRGININGLPATPKAWKGSLSRAHSPAATPSRGRSPAPGRSPLIGTPLTASSLNEALSPRSVQGSLREGSIRGMSPAPRTTIGERARSQSRGPSSLQNTPQLGYEGSFGGAVPQVPSISNSPRSQSVSGHSRKPSTKHVPTPLKNIAFYPTPKSQAPGSPPPLPIDMPVHPLLQLNLPSVNGSTKISAGPNSNFRLGGGGNLGDQTIDSVLTGPQQAGNSSRDMNLNNLVISIGMSNACLEEEKKTGRMSPPITTNSDPRLGTPL